MTNEELDRLEALANGATEGPWDWEPHGQRPDGSMDEALFAGPSELHGMLIHRLNILNAGADWDRNGANNRAFIAAARTAVPALIAEVRRLRATAAGSASVITARIDATPPGARLQVTDLVLSDEARLALTVFRTGDE